MARDAYWIGPEHLLVDTFSVVRGRHLGGKISRQRAEEALDALAASTIEVVPTAPLVPRMWELRNKVTGHDAAYVAAAEAMACPLVTSDARLARTGDLHIEVRLALPTA